LTLLTGDELLTADEYVYRDSGLTFLHQTSVVVKVEARNDAHIALSKTNIDGSKGRDEDTDVYEIVIGGWGNTKSVIRKEKGGSHKCTKSTPGILQLDESRPFWVSWTGGNIKFGRGPQVGQDVVCEWQDPNPRDINFVSVSTGWGSSGKWILSHGKFLCIKYLIKLS